MKVREANLNDLDAIWTIFQEIITTGDTFVYDANTPQRRIKKYWFASDMSVYVVENEGEIVGSYFLKPNHTDLGNHIANGSYMVSPKAQGKGIGTLMCEHSIERAKSLGYKAMQFNLVVSTNTVAVKLWQKFGFGIIGTIPKGFRHKTLGLVDAYIMYRSLE